MQRVGPAQCGEELEGNVFTIKHLIGRTNSSRVQLKGYEVWPSDPVTHKLIPDTEGPKCPDELIRSAISLSSSLTLKRRKVLFSPF